MRESCASQTEAPFAWSSEATIDRFGGDERLVRELVALFVASCPRLLENLRARLRDGDLHALGRAAHALKGSIGNFTAEGPTRTAHELERICGLGLTDAARATLQRLEQEVSGLVSAMRAFQDGSS